MFQKTTLKNGLRLITANIEGTEAITALVLFKVGSRYETKSENGISHFIEHMMFKGTKKRPNTLALSKDLDRVGAEYNAFTSRDYTGYYVKVDAEKLELALDVLSDMLLNSKFEEGELEKEKGFCRYTVEGSGDIVQEKEFPPKQPGPGPEHQPKADGPIADPGHHRVDEVFHQDIRQRL